MDDSYALRLSPCVYATEPIVSFVLGCTWGSFAPASPDEWETWVDGYDPVDGHVELFGFHRGEALPAISVSSLPPGELAALGVLTAKCCSPGEQVVAYYHSLYWRLYFRHCKGRGSVPHAEFMSSVWSSGFVGGVRRYANDFGLFCNAPPPVVDTLVRVVVAMEAVLQVRSTFFADIVFVRKAFIESLFAEELVENATLIYKKYLGEYMFSVPLCRSDFVRGVGTVGVLTGDGLGLVRAFFPVEMSKTSGAGCATVQAGGVAWVTIRGCEECRHRRCFLRKLSAVGGDEARYERLAWDCGDLDHGALALRKK